MSAPIVLAAHIGLAHAQATDFTPDSGAPIANRPSIDRASTTVPVVNIVAPNARGLSHNKYTDFNVPAGGAVLNNSIVEDDTRSFGRIGANPNFAGVDASTILNEVTSTNPSTFSGHMEVHGGQANVIIANPNGITCNECSVFNSRRFTLTTGVPNIVDDRLAGFSVNKGHIAVRGESYVLPSTIQGRVIEFISKTFELTDTGIIAAGGSRLREAGLVNIVTGQNDVRYLGAYHIAGDAIVRTGQAIDTSRAGFAIDAAALGSMLAGNIILVSTQQGVGVNTAGISDDIRVSSRLATRNLGSGSVYVRADGNVRFENGRHFYTPDAEASDGFEVISNLGGVFINDYDIGTRFADVSLMAAKDITINLSKITTERDRDDISFTSTNGGVFLTDTDIQSAGDISASGFGITLDDTAGDRVGRAQLKAGSDITLNADTFIENGSGGLIDAGRNLTMTLGPNIGIGPLIDVGEVKVGRVFRATGFGADIRLDRPIQVGTSLVLDTAGTLNIGFKAGDVSIAGDLEAGAVTIDTGSINAGGLIKARNGKLSIVSNNQSNLEFAHGLSSTTSLTLGTDGNIVLRENVSAGGDIVINALNGDITNHAAMSAGGKIELTTFGDVINRATIESLSDITINARNFSNLITFGGISFDNFVAADGDDIDIGAVVLGEGVYRVEKGRPVRNDVTYLLEGGQRITIFNQLFLDRCGVSFVIKGGEIPGGFTCLYSYEESLPTGLTGTVIRPEVFAEGNMNINLTDAFLNRAGLVEAGGSLSITANSFVNEGVRATKTAEVLGFTFLGMSTSQTASFYRHPEEICAILGGVNFILLCDAARFFYFDKAFDDDVVGLVPDANFLPGFDTLTSDPVVFEVETTVPDVRATARVAAGGALTIDANSIVENVGTDLAVLPALDPNAFLLSIDAALARLRFDGDIIQKQAGISFDEAVVREQVVALTGARLLDGFGSTQQQLLALTEAGRRASEAFNLAPGVDLSAAEVSRLSEDVVVYVKVQRNGREIMVPKVYLASSSLATYGTTASISGMSVQLSGGNIDNSGHILGRVATVVEASTGMSQNQLVSTAIHRAFRGISKEDADRRAGSVKNTGVIGSLDMENNIATVIKSDGSITSSGVVVGRNVQLQAGIGDINIETDGKDAAFGKVAVVGAMDDITLSTRFGGDVNVTGAMVESLQGDIAIDASNLNVKGLEVKSRSQNITDRDNPGVTTESEVEQERFRKTTTTTTVTRNRFSGTTRTSSNETLYGSVLQATSGNLYVETYADTNIEGSTVKAGGDTVLAVGRDLNIKALKTTDTYIEVETESGTISTVTTVVPEGSGYTGSQGDGLVALFNIGVSHNFSKYNKSATRAGVIELVKPSVVEIGGSLYMDVNGDATLDGALVSVGDNLFLDIGGDMALLAKTASSYTSVTDSGKVDGKMVTLTPLMLKGGLEYAKSTQIDMVEWTGNVKSTLDVGGNAVGTIGGDVTNEGVTRAVELNKRGIVVGGVQGDVFVEVGGTETRITPEQNSRKTTTTYEAMNYGVYVDLTLPGGGDPDSEEDGVNLAISAVGLITGGPSSLFAPSVSISGGSINKSTSVTEYEDGSTDTSSTNRNLQVTVSIDPQARGFDDFYVPVEVLNKSTPDKNTSTGRPRCSTDLCKNPQNYVGGEENLLLFHWGESAAGAKGIVVDAKEIVRSKISLMKPDDVANAADNTITRLNQGAYEDLAAIPDNVKKSILVDHKIITPAQAKNATEKDLNALLAVTLKEVSKEYWAKSDRTIDDDFER
ncbi:MAG: filamentous hemagglutinin N-terminal domain-containing protein [Alphaproteobacteria bacterium]